jgi:fructokinase
MAPELVCMGELLIDFVATARGPLGAEPGFVKAPGGAPANVAVAAARLGRRAGFIGAVGDDAFGRGLRDTLRSNGVDTRGLRVGPRGATPLAFVSLGKGGERDFAFWWSGTADHFLRPEDVPAGLVRSARIFHFGSIGLIHPATRRATRAALDAARGSRTFVSFDPNLRLPLWPSAAAARYAIRRMLPKADLVKVNDEELHFLTGHRDLARGMRALGTVTPAALFVTLGPHGAAARWGAVEALARGFKVRAVDTTGAGDGFTAGLHCRLLEQGRSPRSLAPDAEVLGDWLRSANAVGALATTRRGAIPAFPTASEVARLLRAET